MIKDSILKFLHLDGLINNLTGYVETRMELLKYELKEDIAKALARVFVFFSLTMLGTIAIVFASTAIAFKIGQTLGFFTGFGLVACFYLVVALVLFTVRNNLIKNVEQGIKKTLKRK